MRGTAVEPALSPARRGGGPSGTSADTGGSLPPSTLTAASDTSRTLDEVCRRAMSGTTAVARASAEATIWEMLSWVGASISPTPQHCQHGGGQLVQGLTLRLVHQDLASS